VVPNNTEATVLALQMGQTGHKNGFWGIGWPLILGVCVLWLSFQNPATPRAGRPMSLWEVRENRLILRFVGVLFTGTAFYNAFFR